MFYIVYKITNLINNRYYIGAHSTSDLDDGYFGSGTLIKRAVKKYGKNNFKKEILFMAKDENSMYLTENELVKTYEDDPLSYNMRAGGVSGTLWTEDRKSARSDAVSGRNNPMFGVRRFGIESPHYGKPHSDESLEKMRTIKLRNSYRKGKPASQETRDRIKLAAKNRIKSPCVNCGKLLLNCHLKRHSNVCVVENVSELS